MRSRWMLLLGILMIMVLSASVLAADWISIVSGTEQNLQAVDFISQSTGWAVGGLGIGFPAAEPVIIKTIDGGNNWTSQSVPAALADTIVLTDVCFINSRVGWAVGSTGTILKTTTGGTTWLQQNSPTGANLNSVACLDENTALAVGSPGFHLDTGFFGNILKTTNGLNWTSRFDDPSGDITFNSIFFVDSTTGWVVGMNRSGGVIYKTADGGESWERQESGAPVGISDIYCLDAGTCWVSSSETLVRQTTDGGSSWSSHDSGWLVGKDIHFMNATTGFLGGENLLLESNDSGRTWNFASTDISTGTGLIAINAFIRDFDCRNTVCWAVGDEGTIIRRGEPRYATFAPPPNRTVTVPGRERELDCPALFDDCEAGWDAVFTYNESGCAVSSTCVEEGTADAILPGFSGFSQEKFSAFIGQVPGLSPNEKISVYVTRAEAAPLLLSFRLEEGSVVDIALTDQEDWTLKAETSEKILNTILAAEDPATEALAAIESKEIKLTGRTVGKKIKLAFLRIGLKLAGIFGSGLS